MGYLVIVFMSGHTEKYSAKSFVANFHTQMSSSHSEERTMIFTSEKKWYVQSEATAEVREFRAKIPAFNRRLQCPLQRRFADIQRGKFFSKIFSGKKKWNTSRKLEWNSFVCLSMKKNVESRQNNSGRGKTERHVSLRCAFYRSYFVFYLNLYSNRLFYLSFNSFI